MVTKQPNMPLISGFALKALFVATTACIAVTLLAIGFAACMLPSTANAFAKAFSDAGKSPYLEAELEALAVETRDYTVGDYGRSDGGTQLARERLALATVLAAQNSTSGDSPKRSLWPEGALEVIDAPPARENPIETVEKLAGISPSLALGEDELSHLDDCHAIFSAAKASLIAIALLAAAGVALLLLTGNRRLAGSALVAGPAALAMAMLALGAWAAADFNIFFSAFHGLLFPQGNWTFPHDSLLISMLPLDFWMSMALLWLAVTLAACIIAMLFGRHLKKTA